MYAIKEIAIKPEKLGGWKSLSNLVASQKHNSLTPLTSCKIPRLSSGLDPEKYVFSQNFPDRGNIEKVRPCNDFVHIAVSVES